MGSGSSMRGLGCERARCSVRGSVRALGVVLLLACCGLLASCSGFGNGDGNANRLLRIEVTPQVLLLDKGVTMRLVATGYYAGTSSEESAAKLRDDVVWRSSKPTIAAVDAEGAVKGLSVGSATITAEFKGFSSAASLTVNPPALEKITVAPDPSSLPLGETEQFGAAGTYTDGTTQDLTRGVTWTASGPSVSGAISSGKMVAAALGTFTITAKAGRISGSATLTVTPPVVVALKIQPASASMVLGSNRQLAVVATLSDGTIQDVTQTADWSAAHPNIVSVDTTGIGVVIAQHIGSASVSATVGGFTGSANVTVVPLLLVNYFNRANALQACGGDTVQLVNPGLASGNICAMVYVFDSNQEMNECCGCPISDLGMRTLSVVRDLTTNTLTGKKPLAGNIMIVPSDPGANQQCEASAPTPDGSVAGWETHAAPTGAGTFEITESSFEEAPLSASEAAVLSNECGFIEKLGSGNGICSCGVGK